MKTLVESINESINIVKGTLKSDWEYLTSSELKYPDELPNEIQEILPFFEENSKIFDNGEKGYSIPKGTKVETTGSTDTYGMYSEVECKYKNLDFTIWVASDMLYDLDRSL